MQERTTTHLPDPMQLLLRAYEGAGCYMRDATLQEEAIRAYRPGMLLRERAALCASDKATGLAGNIRFYILSAAMLDLRRGTQGEAWGQWETPPQSRFALRDVYTHAGKTMVILLHLRADEPWQPYQLLPLEQDEWVRRCREHFMQSLQQEPLPALCEAAWLEKCAFAPGLDETCRPIPLAQGPVLVTPQGQMHAVDVFPYRIGRYPGCELTVDDLYVSRLHAVLTDTAGGYQIADCHSTNGTRVNDDPLAPGQPRPLQEGDIIRLSPTLQVTFRLL